jgi:hypothetical protein
MPNYSLDKGYSCIYQSIEKGCLHCKSHHPCPALIVIAMRYSREIADLQHPRNGCAPTQVMFITES